MRLTQRVFEWQRTRNVNFVAETEDGCILDQLVCQEALQDILTRATQTIDEATDVELFLGLGKSLAVS